MKKIKGAKNTEKGTEFTILSCLPTTEKGRAKYSRESCGEMFFVRKRRCKEKENREEKQQENRVQVLIGGMEGSSKPRNDYGYFYFTPECNVVRCAFYQLLEPAWPLYKSALFQLQLPELVTHIHIHIHTYIHAEEEGGRVSEERQRERDRE